MVRHEEIGEEESPVVFMVERQDAEVQRVHGARRSMRDGSERWRLAVDGLKDEVLGVTRIPMGAPGANGEREAEEHEVLGREENQWLGREVAPLEVGAVDAEVGHGRRIGEAEGDLDGAAGAGDGFGGGGILADGEVGLPVEENPGSVATSGARCGGGLGRGSQEKRCLHGDGFGGAGCGQIGFDMVTNSVCTNPAVERANN